MRNAYLQLCDYGSRFRILKGGKVSLVVSAFLVGTTLTHAAPTGGVVTSGSATIAQSGVATTINQSSQKASINWTNFSIGASEVVNFNQPNASAITLNRVIGNEKSIIDGALNANGQVWLLNSNGVLFNSTAKINTSGLLATTKALSDEEFQNGVYRFKGDSTASVINLGEIDIANGGYVSLLANTVQNEGTIRAIQGTVTLTGANEATINLNGNSLVSLHVNKGVLDALVENKGAIIADGGKVYLTTNAVDELLRGVVNNTGKIQANSLSDVMGEVILFAHGGTAEISGSIDAEGGFVETSGKEFSIDSTTKIKAAHWLIDPTNLVISDATAYENALASGDVTIQTQAAGAQDGDIFVNDTIAWSSNYDLELNAHRNIYINENITATGATAKVKLYYGQGAVAGGNSADYYILPGKSISLHAGQNLDTKLGSDGSVINYTVITGLGNEGSTTGTDLQGINGNLAGNYALGSNIDATSTSSWNAGNGFTPLFAQGNMMNLLGTPYSGIFTGLGHTVSNLTINRPNETNVGLFGKVSGTVRNIGIVGGTFAAGGGAPLVGYLDTNGKVLYSYATANISSNFNKVGGLVGENLGTIAYSYATGDVSISGYGAGGLVGYNEGDIINSYATGDVSGNDQVGGLVGRWEPATPLGSISNAYATGMVTAIDTAKDGGLVGYVHSNYIGSLISTNSFWDTPTTGQADSFAGGTGKTTSAFTTLIADASWDTNMWDNAGYASRPYLKYVTRDTDKITRFSGGYGTSNSPFTITTATQLQNMDYADIVSQNFHFTLLNNIDLTGITWNPIGDNNLPFIGTFDGSNHTINHLTINNPNDNYQGLFGYADHSTIKNIGLLNVSINGSRDVGGLVGWNEHSTIDNSYVTGSITGTRDVGGLVGYNVNSTISDSYSTASVSASDRTAGGLVGTNYSSTITDSYSTGAVTGTDSGGFAGYNRNASTIINSYWDVQTSGKSNGVGWQDGTSTSDLIGHVTTSTVQPPNITHILNGTAIIPPLTMFDAPQMQQYQMQPQRYNMGEQTVQLLGTPMSDVPTELVSMQEARRVMGVSGDLHVPVGQYSLIQLINGGVRLPNGIEQEFFMAQR